MSDSSRPFDLAAMRARLAGQSGERLWRSIEELCADPRLDDFLQAEFPNVAPAEVDRRAALRLMATSLALGGLAACGDRSRTGAPLLSRPRALSGQAAGEPSMLATSLELGGYGCGVLVRAQDGRPIKIEGNPLHPASLGATDVFAQAEVLSLYDPDRSREPRENGQPRDWQAMERFIRGARNELVVSEGRGLHILMPPLASPTVERMMRSAREVFPHAVWHAYAPITDEQRWAGAELAFGRAVDLVYDLRQADVIVTIGGDLFAGEPGRIRYAADYQTRRRDADRPLPRLVAIESTPSLAGARADERIVLRPREIEGFARALPAALESNEPVAAAPPAAMQLAAELRRAGRRALIVVGREQPPVVHALAHAIHVRLDAFGTTLRAIDLVLPASARTRSIADLATAIAAGSVSRLLILGGNPAYDAPADLDLAALIPRVPLSLHVGYYADETAALCRWHIPQCHVLEGFGDLRAFDGSVGLQQPATARLAPSFSVAETLSVLIGQAVEGRAIIEPTWREAWGSDLAIRLDRALEDGIVEGTAFASVPVKLQEGWKPGPPSVAPAAPIDIVFAPDPCLWDGRFANNGWLQELPKPLSKQVWGNAALIAPETAEAMRVASGDVIEIAAGDRAIAAPAWILPGQAAGTVTLPLGYGRRRAGAVGNLVGFDAYPLRTSAAPWLAAGEARPLGRRQALVSTQHHHAVAGRDVVRIVAPDETAERFSGERPSLYPAWTYEGHAWAMTIDLDACIGCNACVIACQAENNVAVVGPEQVARGREMHWLRVDRYHAGDPAAPATYFQPVPCMHCETAPCEVVCPVNATVHSAEGLNDMVYNRCIGTRTCSNNCPYKVRRFNFLDYQGGDHAVPADVLNPQVTVRERGVMEKCTYCVQRISAARIAAGIEDRRIRDGEIMTACQQACPTEAIVFGDVNDPDSAVSRLKRSPRNYALLGELNTKPRTTYLARLAPRDDESG
jgi:molybdopterin-containing oxidoreductase family iron-sulfur binding subunit